jgi:hypothetical protein
MERGWVPGPLLRVIRVADTLEALCVTIHQRHPYVAGGSTSRETVDFGVEVNLLKASRTASPSYCTILLRSQENQHD